MADIPRSYLEDASGLVGHADELVAPSTVQELAAVFADCYKRRIPLTLSGAGTGVTGGRVAQGGCIVSLERFRRLEIHEGYAIVGAGVSLGEIQAAAQAKGQFFPPDPTEQSASIGGAIATNASGSRSFYYGSTRKWIRLVEAVLLPGIHRTFRRGDLVDFPFTPLPEPRTRKHTAGYRLREDMDWIDLLAGSEGTLAAIAEAELTLLPQPYGLLSGVVFFPSQDLALAAVEDWRGIDQFRMLEYLDDASLRVLSPAYPDVPKGARAALLVEQILDGLPGDPVDAWIERIEASSALGEESWFGETAQDRERFRIFRHALPELVNERVRRNGFRKMNSDYAVPVEANVRMMDCYSSRLEQELPGRYVVFGHIGDAHVHVNILPETEADARTGQALMLEFARHAVSLGGTVSAEHGLGRRKAHLLELEFDITQIESMRSVKRRLDPDWLLGRGVLFYPE